MTKKEIDQIRSLFHNINRDLFISLSYTNILELKYGDKDEKELKSITKSLNSISEQIKSYHSKIIKLANK